jgi:glycosyltransferase involved in cell wall biosynthesis
MVKKCDYLGYKNAQELSEILSSSYCFVMPSTFEPWGMAVIEAAACGLPVILSSEVGCGSDIFIDNLTPLFEPENEIDLANLLLEADSWSEAEWCSRRNASLEAVSKVHPKEWISKFEKILYVN